MQSDTVAIPPRLPLYVQPGNRTASVNKDARLINCYIETDPVTQEVFVYRRPGLLTFENHGAGLGLGVYNWEGDVYSIFIDDLYRNGVVVAANVSLAGDTKVYFNAILGATPKLVFGDGEYAYTYYVAGGISAELHSINVEYPDTTVKGFGYVNGATYVMQLEAVIWGSKINSVDQVGDWDPLDFISAQADPDYGIALNKQLVYLIAFNQYTLEVFFDAGNPTGSPLGNVQGSLKPYGCAHADSVQRIDDTLVWLCKNRTNSLQIIKMADLTLEIVSTKPIDRLIAGADLDDPSAVMSWQIKFGGHSFYIITLISLNLTLAYDLAENMWSQWTDANGNYLPIIDATFDSEGRNILQHETNGSLMYMSPEYYTDDTDIIQVDIYTPSFQGQTYRRKQLNRMTFIADQVDGSMLQVRHTDNDYISWSNFRQVDLGRVEPMLTNCGTFKKRAYNFRHRCKTFFRMSAVELQYDIGTL